MNRFRCLLLAAGLLCIAPPAASAAAPANDAFEAAAVLPAPPSTTTGTLVEATRQTGEPRHVSRNSPSVWYSITPTESGVLRANTCDTEVDTVLSVYTGTAVNALASVVENDDSCGRGSDVTWPAVAGTTYRIAIATYSEDPPAAELGFKLALTRVTVPSNDAFADARVLNGPVRLRGSNRLATRELGEPKHARQDGGHSVWFRYKAKRSETLTVDTTGSNFDTTVGIYRGDLGRLKQVASNDDASQEELTSLARFKVRRGLTYFIALDGASSDDGDNVGDWELGLSDGGAKGTGLSLTVDPGQTLGPVIASGLRTSVRCILRCRVRVTASIGQTTARALGLGRGITTIARTEGTLGGDDPERPAVLRLSRAARQALAGRNSLSLTVRARLLRTGAKDRTVSQRITLQR